MFAKYKQKTRPKFFSNILVAIVSLFFLNCPEVDASPIDVDVTNVAADEEVESYLTKFNYMRTERTGQSVDASGKPIVGGLLDGVFLPPKTDPSNGISTFQRIWGLNVTGKLNNETLRLMKKPRCGLPDVINNEDDLRKKRYALRGDKWAQKKLKYKFINYSPDLPQSTITSNIERAFKMWSDHIPLDFELVSKNSDADIEISFASRAHSDGADYAFDGPGKTLAHAFFPSSYAIGGDTHFDEDETWTVDSYAGTNLLQVAVHEFGHALGLSHSENTAAIMAPFYDSYDPNLKLHNDDIQGIQALYGSKQKTTKTTNPPTPPQSSPSPICSDAQFDALTELGDGELYGFKGDKYYKITANGIASGYPRLISSDFPGVPDNLDAAVHFVSLGTNDNARTYFFKDDTYWRIENFRVISSKLIKDGFPGIPNNINAAFSRVVNGNIYFIKGKDYYRYIRGRGVPDGYPRPLSLWKGLPSNVTNAYEWGDRNYFTSKLNYYRYNDFDDRVDDGYPKNFGKLWLNCDANSPGSFAAAELQANQYRLVGAAADMSSSVPGLTFYLALLFSIYALA